VPYDLIGIHKIQNAAFAIIFQYEFKKDKYGPLEYVMGIAYAKDLATAKTAIVKLAKEIPIKKGHYVNHRSQISISSTDHKSFSELQAFWKNSDISRFADQPDLHSTLITVPLDDAEVDIYAIRPDCNPDGTRQQMAIYSGKLFS